MKRVVLLSRWFVWIGQIVIRQTTKIPAICFELLASYRPEPGDIPLIERLIEQLEQLERGSA